MFNKKSKFWKGLSNCIDPIWICSCIPSLYVHYMSLCIIGFCQDLLAKYTVTPESFLFIMTVSSLITKLRLWPRTFKPPRIILCIYVSLASIFLTNIAFRLIWLPLLFVQSTINTEISNWLGFLAVYLDLEKTSPLYSFAQWLTEDQGLMFGARLMSLLLFCWMLEATGKFEVAREYIEMLYCTIREAMGKEPKKKEISKSRRSRRRTSCTDLSSPNEYNLREDVIAAGWDDDTE